VGFCCVGLDHFVMCGSANEVVVVVVGLRGGKGVREGGRRGLEREAVSVYPVEVPVSYIEEICKKLAGFGVIDNPVYNTLGLVEST